GAPPGARRPSPEQADSLVCGRRPSAGLADGYGVFDAVVFFGADVRAALSSYAIWQGRAEKPPSMLARVAQSEVAVGAYANTSRPLKLCTSFVGELRVPLA